MKLIDGGASLLVDGQPHSVDGPDALSGEYPRLYAHMARLVDQNTSDVDLRPMSLVLDAFTLGNRRITEPFYD